MSRRRSHKDVEFAVTGGTVGANYYKTYRQAYQNVMDRLVSSGRATLDVLVSSEAGARWCGGDDSVAYYREDPDASVFERFTFKCNAEGRVR